jgi:hypothetical protein
MLARVTVLLAALVLCATAGAMPRNDKLLALDQRAGPYRYLQSFKKGTPRAYAAAVAAFGAPTRKHADGNLCHVTWAKAGVTVGFASQQRPCTAANLRIAAWYGMSLFGDGWHTTRGIHVGDPVTVVRRVYPHARFDNYFTQQLVLVRKQVAEFDFVYLAVTLDAGGRIATIEVPAGYIY